MENAEKESPSSAIIVDPIRGSSKYHEWKVILLKQNQRVQVEENNV